MKKSIIIITMLCLGGCGIMLNPYKDNFSCSDYDKGKCIKVAGAYKESLQKKKSNTLSEKENKAACEKCRQDAKNNNASEDTYCTACFPSETNESENKRIITESSATMYQKAVNKKLATMLREPNTPLVAPPQVIRVLVLPYKGDMNELYMMRYIYLLVDDPKWVVGNYLIDSEE
ncbi:MAG: type IV conjugative transfer system protein TraV [Deltaproteobacteria bacterium HGW-Deltaproteobacteria-12]|nr:MAG: type IV conjugative transfer system protein TraV [Deltaproteobacteria bacterium HGW-Deltaproteobacteria-12]